MGATMTPIIAPPQMSERQLQACVIDLAHVLGFRVAHFRPAFERGRYRTPVDADGAGFVDLVLAKPGRVLFVELKAENGRLTAQQKQWVEVLGADVWTPALWHDGTIHSILAGSR